MRGSGRDIPATPSQTPGPGDAGARPGGRGPQQAAGAPGCFFCGQPTVGNHEACRVSFCELAQPAGSDEPGRPGTASDWVRGLLGPERPARSRTQHISIPRCPRCQAAHLRRNRHHERCLARGAAWGAALGLLAGIVLDVMLSLDRGFHAVGLFVPVLTALLGALPGRLLGGLVARVAPRPLPAGVRSPEDVSGHPVVSGMIESGWFLGEPPNSRVGGRFGEAKGDGAAGSPGASPPHREWWLVGAT